MADAGIEKYEFIAVIDDRTSKKCRERDSEFFLLSKKVVDENYPSLNIGNLSNLEKSIIEKTLEYFENQIADAKAQDN